MLLIVHGGWFKKVGENNCPYLYLGYICSIMATANTFFGFYFSFFYFRMKPGMLLLKTR